MTGSIICNYFIILMLCINFVDVLILNGPPVSYVGARATFACSGEDIVSVQWLVNGTLDDGLNMNLASEFSQIRRVGDLLIRDVLMEYNGITIQCRANSSSESITYSNNITLLVQGWLYNQYACSCYIKSPFLL